MPFVDFPLECTTCRGSGRTKPASAFAVNEEFLSKECLACQGTGKIKNMVYVNPMPEIEAPFSESEIEKNQNEISQLYKDAIIRPNDIQYDIQSLSEKLNDEKEIAEVVEEIKNIKTSKRSRKVELDDAS